MINIEQTVNLENEIEKFIEVYRENSDLPLILFGAGLAVRWYINFVQGYKIPIHCIVDGKIGVGEEKKIEGIEVRNVEEIYEKYERANIIISAPKYREEIGSNIKQRKPLYNVFSFDPTLRVLHGVTEEERRRYFITNKDKIASLWDSLEDAFSKRTLEQIVKGSITGNCDYYADISNDTQYFPDFVVEKLGGGIRGYRCFYRRHYS